MHLIIRSLVLKSTDYLNMYCVNVLICVKFGFLFFFWKLCIFYACIAVHNVEHNARL